MTAEGHRDAKASDDAKPRRRAGRPSVRASRRQLVLDRAVQLFNRKGIAATPFADIADELGLTRAALYYYFADRSDLVFQCYSAALDQMAEDLADASEAGSGFEALMAFIDRSLGPGRPAQAIVTELGLLTPAQADVIAAARARNASRLADFVAHGAADGSLRPLQPDIVAQSLIGILAWARVSPAWTGGVSGDRFRVRLSAALKDLLTHGAAGPHAGIFACAMAVDALSPLASQPGNPFDRGAMADARLEVLLATASRLFNRHGIEGTSIDSIAAALGMTSGAVYHYFPDKPALVAACYRRGFDLFERIAETAHRQGQTGLERAILGTHLNAQGQAGLLSPLMPQPGLDALPRPLRGELAQRANRLKRLYAQMLRQGAADGSSRIADPLLVAQLCAGAFGWLPKWLPDDDPRAPRAIADEICALFWRGLHTQGTGS